MKSKVIPINGVQIMVLCTSMVPNVNDENEDLRFFDVLYV